MAEEARLICAAADLEEAGRGVRFEVQYCDQVAPAFVLRYRGKAHAYLNRCAHLPMELDWREGEFFDLGRRDLICSTHGATYAADSGACIGGPCGKTPLVRLRVEERGSSVYYLGSEDD